MIQFYKIKTKLPEDLRVTRVREAWSPSSFSTGEWSLSSEADSTTFCKNKLKSLKECNRLGESILNYYNQVERTMQKIVIFILSSSMLHKFEGNKILSDKGGFVLVLEWFNWLHQNKREKKKRLHHFKRWFPLKGISISFNDKLILYNSKGDFKKWIKETNAIFFFLKWG